MSDRQYWKSNIDGRVIQCGGSMPEEWVKLTQKAGEAAHSEQCADDLRKMLKPGSNVYCILRHVSSSGMSRRISLAVVENGAIVSIDWLVQHVLSGVRQSGKEGLTVSGCGMDMGFHLVYGLGKALWPTGTPEPHGMRNGEPDSDGGYALKSVWL